jgi:spectinomycin phosphotransferase
MLESPNLRDEKIIKFVKDEYGLAVSPVLFLPIGADFRTAV